MSDDPDITHAFTVDVEEWFHLHSTEIAPVSEWPSLESHVERQTDMVLAVLDDHDVRGTFFVLGWVAERYPSLVRTIAEAGHEIGCHSYHHPVIHELEPDEFDEDLERAVGAISEATGEPVISYRAPSFSVTREMPWFFETLAKRGIEIDSSICPAVRHDGGHSGFGERTELVDTPHGDLREVPVSTYRIGPSRLGSLGGGYFRFFPLFLTSRQLDRMEEEARSGVFYMHPYDIDPDQPRRRMSPTAYFRKYVGLRGAERKLNRLLDAYDFAPLGEAFLANSHPATTAAPA